jgi:streptogramin lyase
MLRLSICFRLVCLGLCAAVFFPQPAFPYGAVQNKADNTEIRIVPALGKVVVDGKLDDWDRSGEIFMFVDEQSRDTLSLTAAMMYDGEALYVGGHWKDPTPLLNQTAFGGDVSWAWNADAIQIRFISNPAIRSRASTMTGGRMPPDEQAFVNNITLWHSTTDGKAGYHAAYTLNYQDPVLNPPGVQGMFVKDADGQGATFEYRVPWSVLKAVRPLKGGDAVQTQFQIHWGNEKGTELKTGITDVRNPASNSLGYMGPDGWGLGVFMEKGNLPKIDRPATERATGHMPVTFSLPKPGKVSISIRDAAGKTVRTGIGAEPYPAGEHIWLWDGLDDRDQPLPVGKYTAKILTHDGMGQKYVCDVGVSGEPPYQTPDGTGGWSGDYWEPAYMAIEGDAVILGTGNAEAAPYTIRTDLEGRKQWGTTAAGQTLAVHKGFGYFVAWATDGNLKKFDLATGRLTPFSGGQPTVKAPGKGPRRGLAPIDAATFALSSESEDRLYLIDIASGQAKAELPLPAAKGLAADGQGRLYAVSGSAMGRVDPKTGGFTPLAKDLADPQQLACDAAGNVYVSLRGKEMQVWKLDPTGKVLKKFGKPGGRPALGRFDPAGILNPYGIAVDANDRLWVCEADREPKRYSVWNPDGTLWKDFFGSLPYSTSGYFDPQDPEKFYALSVRYLVDYDKGTWKPDATILRTRVEEGVPLGLSPPHAVSVHGGGAIVVRDGRKFLFTVAATPNFAIFEEKGDAWLPRASLYVATTEVPGPVGKDGKPGPVNKVQTPSFWVDANNDGRVQASESVPVGERFGSTWKMTCDAHLNLYTLQGDGWTEPRAEGRATAPFSILRLDCLGFGPEGGLRFAEKHRPVVRDEEGGSVNGISVDPDGSVYVLVSGGLVGRGERAQATGARLVKYSPSGKEVWRYAKVHCGFAWTSASYTPGMLVAAFGCPPSSHPDLLPVTGYYGQYFLVDKQDGLFVDAVGQDQRSNYTLDHTMVLTENFNGNIFKHPKTAKTYFTGGDADCRIWELTGLESMKRHSVALEVTPPLLAQAQKNAAQNRAVQLALLGRNAGGRKSAVIKRLERAAADGSAGKWQGIAALPIGDDKARPAEVQLAYDATHLFARFRVKAAVPFINTPTDPKLLFKSGSGLEICLTPHMDQRQVGPNNRHPMQEGDLRIVLARTKDGKLLATRYRPKTRDQKKPAAAYFETQSAGREDFDEIAEWNDLPMHFEADKDGYTLEVAVPWAATAVRPVPGTKFLADAGVIYGDAGGGRNAARALWSDRTPEVGVNNDIPTESRMHPNGWGAVQFE